MIAMSFVPLNSTAAQSDIQLAAVYSDSKDFHLTPIAMMRNGKLLNPVLYQRANQQTIDRFVRLHYAQGTTMFIWQSGQARGKLRLGVLQPGCDSDYTFHATPIGETSFDKSQGAIASSQDIGAVHPNYRESSTEEERAVFARVSQKALSKSHPSITPKTPVKIHHLNHDESQHHWKSVARGIYQFPTAQNRVLAFRDTRATRWRVATCNNQSPQS